MVPLFGYGHDAESNTPVDGSFRTTKYVIFNNEWRTACSTYFLIYCKWDKYWDWKLGAIELEIDDNWFNESTSVEILSWKKKVRQSIVANPHLRFTNLMFLNL